MEDIRAKVASLETALMTAREETRAATQRAEALLQQVGSAEDAVKV